MQTDAPEAFDLSRETAETLALYGLPRGKTDGFAWQCLVARRLAERGVRFIELIDTGSSNNWDAHGDLPTSYTRLAREIDQPIAALIADLKRRGMLDDTLVVWTTEFGRMPFTQRETGRDHNGGTFVTWLAGVGIKGGATYGQSDEFSYQAAEGRTFGYDLHATILHVLGIDHERLTWRHNGIDRRLTDVHGHVVHEVLA